MSGEPRDPDWRLMSADDIADALDAMVKLYNATVAINTAFAEHLDRSRALSPEDRQCMYEWNARLCVLNVEAAAALDRGRAVPEFPTPQ